MATKPLRHLSLSEVENKKKPGFPKQCGGQNNSKVGGKLRHQSVAESQLNKDFKVKDSSHKPRHLSLRSVSDNDQVGGVNRKSCDKQSLLKQTCARSENKENEVQTNKSAIAAKPVKRRTSLSKIPVPTTGRTSLGKTDAVTAVKIEKEDNNNNKNKFLIVLPKIVLPEDVVNIDIEDGMYEYSGDLIAYLRGMEKQTTLEENYLEGGSTLPDNRALVVDWIIQVCNYFNFCQETLFYSVSLLDNVIDKRDVKGDRLQLVAVASIWIASKLEEYFAADLSKLAYLTQNSYTVKQIVKMETIILSVLNFKLHLPCIQTILKRYVMAALRSKDVKFVKTCQYLIETHMVDSKFPTIPLSLQVASAVFLANVLFHVHAQQEEIDYLDLAEMWSPTLQYYTKYKTEEVRENSLNIIRSLVELDKYDGAKKKYSSQSKHSRLALQAHVDRENVNKVQTLISSASE